MNHPQSLDPYAREFLIAWMKDHQVESLLEVGTGYGQSSIAFAQALPRLRIVTLELSALRAEVAKAQITLAKLNNRIQLIHGDAKAYEPTQNFDLLLLDGPKAQLLDHFMHFITYLNPQGSVWVDNVDFHGWRDQSIVGRRNLSALMRKLIRFIQTIEAHPDYVVQYYPIGDGLMRVWRKYPQIKL